MHEGHRERMRNKILTSPESLAPHEVLEILLFYCIPRKNVNETAHELLRRTNGSIKGVLDADMQVLASVKGVGKETACFLKTINKIVDIISQEEIKDDKILCPLDARKEASAIFKNANKEIFVVFYIGQNGNILGKTTITSNKTDKVDLDLTDINKQLFIHKPSSVLVAHNHLSGNVTPSSADDEATKRLGAILMLSGVNFYDHLIYAENSFYSYHSQGRLDKILNQVQNILK